MLFSYLHIFVVVLKGDQCFCIDLTTENITQLKRGVCCNNNENSTTRNTSESCTIIIYHLNTTKGICALCIFNSIIRHALQIEFWSLFWYAVLSIHSNFAIILMGMIELVVLL